MSKLAFPSSDTRYDSDIYQRGFVWYYRHGEVTTYHLSCLCGYQISSDNGRVNYYPDHNIPADAFYEHARYRPARYYTDLLTGHYRSLGQYGDDLICPKCGRRLYYLGPGAFINPQVSVEYVTDPWGPPEIPGTVVSDSI